MKNFSVFIITLAIISSAKCGVIERGLETFGEAAHLAHQGAADMFLTGKEILFGNGVMAGPYPTGQGIIPGFAHKIGDGFHMLGAGISHVFAGDDMIHSPLSIMKDKLAHEAAHVGPGAVAPVGAAAAAAANSPLPPGPPETAGANPVPPVGPAVAEVNDVVPNP